MAKKKKAPLALLTQAEVGEFADRVEDALVLNLRARDDPDDLFHVGRKALFVAWTTSAALAGDTSQLPVIVHWIQHNDWDYETGRALVRSALRLAGTDPALRAQIYELTDSWSLIITGPVIEWLDPTLPAERELLTELSRSGKKTFADAARKRLATVSPPAWWEAHFEEDPTAGLDDETLAGLEPRLRRFVELNGESDDDEAQAEMLSLLAQFPARAAMAAGLRLLRFTSYGSKTSVPAVAAIVLRHEDGARRFCDLLTETIRHELMGISSGLESDEDSIPFEARRRLVLEALSRFSQGSFEELRANHEHPLATLERIMTHLWPAELDPSPMVEALRTMADPAATEPESGVGYFSSMFERLDPAHVSVLEKPFREALDADFLGAHSLIGPALSSATKRWPRELQRELAIGVLSRPDAKHTLAWAVKTLAHVAPDELVPRLSDERLRKHAYSFSALKAPGLFVHARAELRAGRLTLDEAGDVLRAITDAWGGAASTRWRGTEEPDDPGALPDDATAVAFRAAVESIDPSQAGRPTDEEWSLLRRMRLQASEVERREVFQLIVPPGPWHPDDLKWLSSCVQMARDEHPSMAWFVASALAHHPDPEALALLEQLQDLGDEDEIFDVKELVDQMRQKLGLPVDEDAEDGEEATGSDDW